MAHHIDLGQKGENIAANYLVKKGYRIKCRNWRFNNAEIDIVAEFEGDLIIVEVKTRSAAVYEEPRDSITTNKMKFLILAAEAYIEEKEFDNETRFDVISIKWFGNDKYEIEHIEDAFTPFDI